MKLTIALIIILVVLGALALLVVARRTTAGTEGPWPFCLKKPLSPPEQVLYFRLIAALPDHIVLAQVQMSRFLGVKKGSKKPMQWFGRISQKSVDFLVCTKDATPVAAIELDDKSHTRADRVAADATKDKALADAGLRIIRWHVKSMPDTAAIQTALSPASQAPVKAVKLAARTTSSKVDG